MLRDEIVPFVDGSGLVAPNLVQAGKQGSDNGVMFTSEYYIMLKMRGEDLPEDSHSRFGTLLSCTHPSEVGLLLRAKGDNDQEGPDDYYGVAAVFATFGRTFLPELIISHGKRNWGFFNNEVPNSIRGRDGKINWSAFLVRQPQLIAAMYYAAGEKPLFLLRLYAALVIAFSCRNVPVDQADPRRLAWLLIKAFNGRCWMMNLAAKGWFKRLYRDYGADGMRGVAAYYYKDNHPFIKYWVTE